MRTRAISAVILVIPVALFLWLGGIPWLAAMIAVALLGVHEFFTALRAPQNGHRPLPIAHILLAIALPLCAFLDPTLGLLTPVIALAVILALASLLVRSDLRGALGDWAVSLSAALYVSLPIAYFVALRQRDDGLQWILMAFLCTWACDSFAYLVGRAIGKRKFSPVISPNKTWEGTIGGILAATLTGLLAVGLVGLPPPLALLMGAAVAIAAIAGDLSESLIKRQLGIKDSGSLLPGHGGALDRVDSLLFAVPLVFYIAVAAGLL